VDAVSRAFFLVDLGIPERIFNLSLCGATCRKNSCTSRSVQRWCIGHDLAGWLMSAHCRYYDNYYNSRNNYKNYCCCYYYY